jgi:hypothetical protein
VNNAFASDIEWSATSLGLLSSIWYDLVAVEADPVIDLEALLEVSLCARGTNAADEWPTLVDLGARAGRVFIGASSLSSGAS